MGSNWRYTHRSNKQPHLGAVFWLPGVAGRTSTLTGGVPADVTPGRGDFWTLKIAHAPLPKTCPKTVSAKKGVAFLWKTFLQKNFQVREKILPSALAFGCSHALVPRQRSRQPHSSLISGLLGVEASGIRSKAFFGTKE